MVVALAIGSAAVPQGLHRHRLLLEGALQCPPHLAHGHDVVDVLDRPADTLEVDVRGRSDQAALGKAWRPFASVGNSCLKRRCTSAVLKLATSVDEGSTARSGSLVAAAGSFDASAASPGACADFVSVETAWSSSRCGSTSMGRRGVGQITLAAPSPRAPIRASASASASFIVAPRSLSRQHRRPRRTGGSPPKTAQPSQDASPARGPRQWPR